MKLPKFPRCCLDEKHYCERDAWRFDVAAQLEAELLPRALDAMAALYDDREEFRKGYKMGYFEAMRRFLEAFKQ